MSRALGNNVISLFGIRADKDAAPVSWVRMWAKSMGMKANFEKVEDEALTGSRISEAGFIGSIAFSGEVSENFNKSSLALLECAGFDKTDDTANNKYIYEFSNSINGWCDFIKFHSDTKLKEFYEKCRVNSIAIDIANRAFIGINWNIEGLEGRRSLNSTLTENPVGFVKAERVKSLDTQIKINGSDKSAVVRSMTININNNLETDDYRFGSKNRNSLEAGDSASIEFSATLSFDNTEYDTYLTALETDAVINLEVVLSDSVIKLNQVSLSDVSAPVSGRGKIELSINGTAHAGVLAPVIIEHIK